jgi:hypothetical protein
MKIQQRFNNRSAWALLACFVLPGSVITEAQTKSNYECDEPQPERLCNAANTCGSASSSCTIDITTSAGSARVKPDIPSARNNQVFCVEEGTTVVWMTSDKTTGFVVSFGPDSPFDPDDLIVGARKKRMRTIASTPGCYKYEARAFYSGAVYGTSKGGKPELVVLPSRNP